MSNGPLPPSHDDPVRLTLPHHLRAAAAALFDGLPDRRPEAAAGAAAALERARLGLADRLPPGTELTVDAYRARLVATCPASAAGTGPFSWTPAAAARHLGLRAVALHLCGERRLSVEQAVRVVIADHVDNGAERTPGPWLAQLDPAAQAVVEAHARRWAEQAVAWLPLRLVDPRCLRFLDDDWWPGGARGGRTLVVHGRRDLSVDVCGSRVAVTVAGGTARAPGAEHADAVTALAASLCDPRARVVRIVRVHPASGEVVATDVTPALLRRGVEVVEATASTLASSTTGGPLATRPGAGCTWCHRRDECAPGTAWLQRPDRRSMGLPVAAPAPCAAPA